MAKICISGYYGFKNFGDEMILSVLTEHLSGNDITVFSSNPEFTSKTYGVKSVKSFDFKKVMRAVKETDILISGGGSLLQDVTSLKSLVYYSFVIALGILFNKKVIIFAQGIGPIRNKFAQIIVKNLLKQCALVTVRDENSLELLKKWDIEAKLVCDPVYSLNIEPRKSDGNIGIQLRDFKTMNYNLLHKLALMIVTKFVPPHPLQCGTVSHNRREVQNKKITLFSLQEAQDLEVCKKFEGILHSIDPEIETEIVTEDIISHLASLEYLIGMRFHAILCAIKCGVKTCAINYDIKVEKLAKDAGLPIISMDAHENFEVVYDKLQNLNKNKLLKFVNSKKFDWEVFEGLFFNIE